MNYHNLTYPDMNNGDGLRVVLWLSGCTHYCKNCQNPQTWKQNSGILFDGRAKKELFDELEKSYISGITLTGGDPLFEGNLQSILDLVIDIRKRYPIKPQDTGIKYANEYNILNKKPEEIRISLPDKSIWMYTGYVFEDIVLGAESSDKENLLRLQILKYVDVLVDGPYVDAKRDITLKWRGSSNQRVINVQQTLLNKEIVLWSS